MERAGGGSLNIPCYTGVSATPFDELDPLAPDTRVLHAAAGDCKGLADAAVLLRVWASQRGFLAAPDGGGRSSQKCILTGISADSFNKIDSLVPAIGGFALSTLLVRLLQQGKVAAYMSPPQVLPRAR